MTRIPIEFEIDEAFDVPITEIDRERQERDEAIVAFFEKAFDILNAYQIHQSKNCNATKMDLRMSVRAMAFALGFRLVAGKDGLADLAKDCGVSKQAFGKCMNHFIEQLRLSPLPFQRKEDARKNMAEARRKQVANEKGEKHQNRPD